MEMRKKFNPMTGVVTYKFGDSTLYGLPGDVTHERGTNHVTIRGTDIGQHPITVTGLEYIRYLRDVLADLCDTEFSDSTKKPA